MPFDAIVFTEGTPGTGTVGLAAGLLDPFHVISGDDITLRAGNKYLLGVLYGAVSTPAYCRIKQPSQLLYYEFIAGCDANLDPSPGWTHLFKRPLPLKPGEKINVWSNNATDEANIIGLLVGDGAIHEPAQPDGYIRGISATDAVAYTWTTIPITWGQALPAGKYAVVGLRVGEYLATTAGTGMARLIGLQKGDFRPGVPLEFATGANATLKSLQQKPLWSEWPVMSGIEFLNDAMPNLEVCAALADTDFVVELAYKKIGEK